MPFIRLIIIYIIVIAAALALFNRDKVMELTGLSPNMFWAEDPDETADEAPAQETVAQAPEKDPAKVAPETQTAVVEEPQQPAVTEEPAPPVVQEQAAAQEPEAVQKPTVEQPAEPAPAPVAEEKPVVTAPAQPAKPTVEQALNAARQSYRSGDIQKTETQYVALGDQFPDSADVQGEIGNFYYSQRQYQNAATYYYKTGKALLKSGDQAKLGQIINILQRLAPNMAADLRAQAAN